MESQGTRRSGGKFRRLWWLAAIGALAAVRFYYVQEMIAALMIFSALFVIGAAVVLVVFLLDWATKRTFSWAESGAERLARLAANTGGALFRQTGLSLQRLRLSTVRSTWLSRHS